MILKAERIKRGWTQEQMAEVLGITKSTLVAWERGTRKPQTRCLEEVAKMFGSDIASAVYKESRGIT